MKTSLGTDTKGWCHEKTYRGVTNEWFTPNYIIDKLEKFDLDPCTSKVRPFDIADTNLTIENNGLIKDWIGRVFLNPPYGPQTKIWMEKLKKYGNGIALIFARTETNLFFDHIWNDANSILFIKGRVQFTDCNGNKKGMSGSPSVLIAYGEECSDILKNCGIEGKFIKLK